MSTSYASRPCVDPALLARECRDRGIPTESWFGRANSFAVPLGKGPGTGHVLLKKEDLDAIPRTADQRLAFLDDVGNRETLQKIVLVEATCVTPGAESDPQAVYLCELRDRRHHLARVPIDKAYNVRAADGGSRLAQTLNSGSAWTWQGVVDNIVTAIGLSTSYFVLPFTPDATPENLTYYGGWAWDALCDVLDRIACEVKYDPVLDTFSVVRLGDTDTAATAELAALAGDRTWDAYASDNSRAWRPEKVRVRFPRRPLPTDGSSPVYTVDVTLTATTGVVSGTYVQLDDDLAALAATGSPSNAAACSTRAAERAADWLRKRQGYDRRLLKVYRDFRPTARTKLLGKTLAEYGIDDRGGAMRTEVRSSPDYSLENWHPLRGFAFPPAGSDPPLLCEVTYAPPGGIGGYTVKRLTVNSGGTVVDYSPATTYDPCYPSFQTIVPGAGIVDTWPVGTRVYLHPVPDATGKYTIDLADEATATGPGFVNATTQSISGDKTVYGGVHARPAYGSGYAAAVTVISTVWSPAANATLTVGCGSGYDVYGTAYTVEVNTSNGASLTVPPAGTTYDETGPAVTFATPESVGSIRVARDSSGSMYIRPGQARGPYYYYPFGMIVNEGTAYAIAPNGSALYVGQTGDILGLDGRRHWFVGGIYVGELPAVPFTFTGTTGGATAVDSILEYLTRDDTAGRLDMSSVTDS